MRKVFTEHLLQSNMSTFKYKSFYVNEFYLLKNFKQCM